MFEVEHCSDSTMVDRGERLADAFWGCLKSRPREDLPEKYFSAGNRLGNHGVKSLPERNPGVTPTKKPYPISRVRLCFIWSDPSVSSRGGL